MTVEENEDSKVRVEGGKEEGKTSVDKNDPEFKVKKKCFSGKRKKSKPTSESIIPQMVSCFPFCSHQVIKKKKNNEQRQNASFCQIYNLLVQ